MMTMKIPGTRILIAGASMMFIVSVRSLQPEILYRFQSNQGKPTSRLVEGKDGKFYGTTAGGGRYGFGTVYQVTTNGVLTTLADFDGTNGHGGLPQPTLILGSDSTLYGTCYHGGSEDNGTVFRLTTNGLMTVLVDFTRMKGSGPNGLVLGLDGNFYGTTAWGGSSNLGTVFRLTTDGQLLTLASFTEQIHGTGANPMAGLVLGGDGNFYGTTSQGDACDEWLLRQGWKPVLHGPSCGNQHLAFLPDFCSLV
jgi:uncharacterized repeat protein (TIGR03803 family)